MKWLFLVHDTQKIKNRGGGGYNFPLLNDMNSIQDKGMLIWQEQQASGP